MAPPPSPTRASAPRVSPNRRVSPCTTPSTRNMGRRCSSSGPNVSLPGSMTKSWLYLSSIYKPLCLVSPSQNRASANQNLRMYPHARLLWKCSAKSSRTNVSCLASLSPSRGAAVIVSVSAGTMPSPSMPVEFCVWPPYCPIGVCLTVFSARLRLFRRHRHCHGTSSVGTIFDSSAHLLLCLSLSLFSSSFFLFFFF